MIELPLGFIFDTTHPFMEKLTIVKTSEEKVFCRQQNNFFFKIQNCAMEQCHHFFKSTSVKSVKLLVFVLFSFFIIQIWSEIFFKNNSADYDVTAKVEGKKKSKIFHVNKISKDARKTTIPSYIFLFNLSKSVISFVLCNAIFTTEPMK